MRMGRTPPRTSASAARRPAGPAPMTTTASATCDSVDYNRHAGLDHCRAGTQAASIRKADPAVLTGSHQAESRAIRFAKLKVAQGRAMQQDGRQQQVALMRFCRLAVDREWN